MGCNPELMIEKYADLVYKICMTKLYNFDRSSVEDACQNVFLNYIKDKRVFKDEAHEKAWFIRAAINCCTDIYRKEKRRLESEESRDISEFNIRADNNFEDGELYEMLAVLPDKIRYAVYLFYVEEYPTEEIAKILKTSGASVRMRLKRGREILREKLDKNLLIKNSKESVLDV